MRWGIALLSLLLGLVFAFPRVGLHDGFTRLVFDLPDGVNYTITSDTNTITVRFTSLGVQPADQSVDSPQVASYQVVRNETGTTVFVRLKSGATFKQTVLNDASGRRLILDVSGPARASPSTPAPKTPTPTPAPPPSNSPPKQPKPTVVIDAGHGGVDPGAVGYVTEKAVTLDVALLLKRYLEAQGVQVVLTREADKHLSPEKGTDLSLRAAMADSKRNLFISIHVNSTAGMPGRAQGVETYYFGELLDPSLLEQVVRENGGGTVGQALTQQAKSVARQSVSDLVAQANQRFSREFATAVQQSLVHHTGAVNRGVHQGPWFVIRNARIPAILVEIGFANHPVEGKRLAEAAYRDTIAKGLAAGIVRFLGLEARAAR